ncbi:Copper resistance protein CRF1, partial [Coniochaeta hoffmannii]
RPLQHINKKGRPVSQCQHCRSLRKSRSAHTKCDCGEKMFKCVHLKTTVEGHTDSCCCNHGGRCTCCHKKEHSQLETVPETVAPVAPTKCVKGGIRARRRATVHSESVLNFDENGNRRSSLKHGKASQLNRQNSAYSLQSTSPADEAGCTSPSSTSGFLDRRKSKSEATSPLMTGSSNLAQLNGQLTPLDLSNVDYPWSNKFDMFASASSEFDQPIFSAGLSAASVDWSHYDGLDFAAKAAADLAPSNYSQPQSYGGFDLGGSEQPPTLTTSTSTSGEPSEIDDLISSSFEDLGSINGFRTASVGTGFDIDHISQSLLSNTDLTTLNYDDFKMMKAGNQFLPTPASLAGDEPVLVSTTSATMADFSQTLVEDDPALWMGSDYCNGLPSADFQLPLTDSPDGSSMAPFWGN